jgi:hypothetical protein
VLDASENRSSILKHSFWAGMEKAVKVMATPALSQVDWVYGEREMVRLPLLRLLGLKGRKSSGLWEGAYFDCAAACRMNNRLYIKNRVVIFADIVQVGSLDCKVGMRQIKNTSN